MKKFKILFLVFILCGVIFICFKNSTSSVLNDYYQKINEKTLKKSHLKDTDLNWNRFVEAQDVVDDESYSLVKDVIQGNENEVVLNDAFNQVYSNIISREKRNQLGIVPLKKYIHEVMNVSDILALEDSIIDIENELGIGILTNISVDLDPEDTQHNLVYLSPVNFVFGASSDYFSNDDYLTYKAYIKRAIIQLLQVYGYSKKEAHSISDQLIDFYTNISKNSKLSADLLEVKNIYHKIDFSFLEEVYSRIDMNKYFASKEIKESYYNLVDEGQYRKLNEYFSNEYLDIWKYHLLVMILSNYAPYLSDDYVNVVLNFQKDIGGSHKKEEEQENLDMLIQLFSEETSSLYAMKYRDLKKKSYLEDTFLKIKETYKKMIKENTWLSQQAKDQAILKLEKMNIQIGQENSDFSYLQDILLEDGNLIQNVIEINKMRNRREILKLEGSKVNRNIDEIVVNAYYSPASQVVYVPIALYHLVDLNKDFYFNLGSVGMILAHEVSHAFDWNGSFYDADGNYGDWWSSSDRKKYEQLKKDVIAYYSRYEVLSGRYVNGEKTLNENIADLGAVHCISNILIEQGGKREDAKEMYESYANLWVSEAKDEYTKLLLLMDNHAPNSIRVNAVLSSTSLFYDTYRLNFFDQMYLKEKDRVSVW